MRARRLPIVLATLAAVAAACTGHYTVPLGPPADAATVDSLNACTGALYDPCTEGSQCMSGNCKHYNGAGLTVCTEACTGLNSNSCPPDSTGSAAYCNNMGLCKPV